MATIFRLYCLSCAKRANVENIDNIIIKYCPFCGSKLIQVVESV